MENEIISVMIHTYCSQYEADVISLQLGYSRALSYPRARLGRLVT